MFRHSSQIWNIGYTEKCVIDMVLVRKNFWGNKRSQERKFNKTHNLDRVSLSMFLLHGQCRHNHLLRSRVPVSSMCGTGSESHRRITLNSRTRRSTRTNVRHLLEVKKQWRRIRYIHDVHVRHTLYDNVPGYRVGERSLVWLPHAIEQSD